MRYVDDVLYEMTDGVIATSYVDHQHKWLKQYKIDPIKMGRMCEKFPALQKSWDQFKIVYEVCRSQDDIDRKNP